MFITYADSSRVNIAIIRVCDSVILSACLHDKTKTAGNKIVKLGIETVHCDTSLIN